MKSKNAFWLWAIITALSLSVQAKQQAVAYRVLHARPVEVASALTQPLAEGSKKGAASVAGGTRLARYFRIKSRQVSGAKIRMELFPIVPVLEGYLPSTAPIVIEMTEKEHHEQHYVFAARLETLGSRYFNSTLDLAPNESGSLMTLSLIDSNVPEALVKAFYHAAEQLGFVSNDPQAAIEKDKNERK